MNEAKSIYIGSVACADSINAHYLTAKGVCRKAVKKHVPPKHFFMKFDVGDIDSLKQYVRAWKRGESSKMIKIVPLFIEEVFTIIINRKPDSGERSSKQESLVWAMKIGSEMTQMAFKIKGQFAVKRA